jgi:succinoglycan biosynthesis protein ExoA
VRSLVELGNKESISTEGHRLISTYSAPANVFQKELDAFPRDWPYISVIVPVRNEAAFIRRTLEQLLIQDYDSRCFEVLVADGRSDDATREIVRAMQPNYPNLRLLDNPRRLSSAGRNAGIRAARGDILVIVDGHCELDNPNYLRDLANAFERSGAECVGRPQPLDVSHATTVQRAIAAARSSRLGHHPASHIYTSHEGFVRPQSVAVAYHRTIFGAVGMFDEAFDACEDVEFNHRLDKAGFRCYFTPKVGVRYFPRNDLRGLFWQMVRYGRGRVRLLRKHPDTFTLPGFVPAFFLLGLFLGPVIAMFSKWMAVAYLVSVVLYAAMVLLTSLAIGARTRSLRLLLWLPLVFSTIHCGAGAGILLEFLATIRLSALLFSRSRNVLFGAVPNSQSTR